MKFYEAGADIGAPPETVWAILADGRNYPAWESGVLSVDGTIAKGEIITVVSTAAPKRRFPVTVTEFDPPRAMTWSGGLPYGLFTGVRTFRLTPAPDGGTRFDLREEYSGMLLRLLWSRLPNLGPSFEQFAAGLKARAEQSA
ncbi:MAG TPA: SRPBCC domain-containing protein [Candidatus Limnocylindrales bacterium]|jgi:hypothetical protein